MDDQNHIGRSNDIADLIVKIRRNIENDKLWDAIKLAESLNLKIIEIGYKGYSNRLSSIKYQFNRLESISKKNRIDNQEYEASRNRIVWSILQLLDELEVKPEIKRNLEMLIALAEIEQAIDKFLEISEGSLWRKEILLLSYRINALKKDLEGSK